MHLDTTMPIFIAQLILLLFVGRAIGEVMNRIGQPAIFGQLIAGVVLGPSVFGALAPELHALVFPGTEELKSMLNALTQIGILLLLVFTGMETDLGLLSRKRRAVISTSLSGILVPFAGGVALTYLIPADLLPPETSRLPTALFIGTALAISSVKIVAMVLFEVGAIRRDLGQLVLATAILDDTIAWILIAVIAGIAAHGSVDLADVALRVGITALFLSVCFLVGPRLVAWIIRWTNDSLMIEAPVLTAILLVALILAMVTDLIGVHSALGAFVAGILVGQSPILTEQIETGLRGFIVAFFSPIFFAAAGLGMDLGVLGDPAILLFTLLLAATATAGKFAGALIGGRLGGLSLPESVALASGLNARGSTEVIVASIGLSLGVLTQSLFTMIVAIAILTTLPMPAMLRWAVGRVKVSDEEAERLEKEEADASAAVPHMERALLFADESENGRLAARLAGLFAAAQQTPTTVVPAGSAAEDADDGGAIGQQVRRAIDGSRVATAPPDDGDAQKPAAADGLLLFKPGLSGAALQEEAAKSYSIAFAGLAQPFAESGRGFNAALAQLMAKLEGPVAMTCNGRLLPGSAEPLSILVPSGGSPQARLATEIAMAVAKALGGRVTVLHVFDRRAANRSTTSGLRRLGYSVLADARRLGKRHKIDVNVVAGHGIDPIREILRAGHSGQYDLVVFGAALRFGQRKFLGPNSYKLATSMRAPLLLVTA